MNRTLSILFIVVVASLGAVAYFTNDTAKNFVDTNILGKKEIAPPLPVEPERYSYIVADGTGSTTSTFAIPQVKVAWLETIINKTYQLTGGRVYLSYIDKDSRNNQVLYLQIPKVLTSTPKPKRSSGEISFDYNKRVKAWEIALQTIKTDSSALAMNFQEKKEDFLRQCKELLEGKVYTKSPDNLWSDVIGVINASFIALKNDEVPALKFVVAFSDMVQDTPQLKSIKLSPTPEGVTILVVNPIQNSSKKIIDQVIELEHQDRVPEIIFKPVNQ